MNHRTFQKIAGIFLIMAGFAAGAQVPAGNDWVLQHLQQDFWKFPVYTTGIHRIDSATLAVAGVLSAPGFDARKIQLFANGTEIPVYIEGEADGQINQGDYIEFFGKRNDASMERSSFHDTTYQVNHDFSLYTDTVYYFLSIGNTFLNKRFTAELAGDFNNYLPAENYFTTRVWFEPAGTYSSGSYFGEDYNKDSRYMDGEGWVGFPFGIDNSLPNTMEINLQTQGVYSTGPPAELKYSLVGRSKYTFKFPVYPGKSHHVKLQIDGASTVLDNFTYFGYSVYRNSIYLPASQLSTGYSTKFVFTAVDDMSSNPTQDPTRSDRNSIGRVELTFPHGTNLNNSITQWMWIPDHTAKTKTYFSLTNLTSSTGEPILYDITNSRRIKVFGSGTALQFLIPNSIPGNPSLKECFLTSESNIHAVNKLVPLVTGNRFQDIYTDFSQNQYDYLILTHTSLLAAANQYAQYRKFDGYPKLYQPVVLDVETLFEQFSYGIRNNPLAIENCLKFLIDNQMLPGTILIIGKGYSTLYTRKDTLTFRQSLIPGWGYPAADNVYLSRISPTHLQDVSLGRIAAPGPVEVLNYLEKVRQYEDTLRTRNEMWMKRAIHLGGGNNAGEQYIIKNSLESWEGVYESPYLGGNVTTFLKSSSEPMEIIKSQQLKNLINSGIRVMTFFGHGSATGFDISTDEVANYENEGRYPLVIVNSCYSGDLFNKIYSKSEEFVLTEKKGAIAYIGATNYSTIQVLIEINDTLYHHLANASYGKPIGELMRTSLGPLANNLTSFYHLTSYQQTTLHGDPAIVLSVQDKPDYRINETQVYFSPSNVTNEIDSFNIYIISQNAGMAVKDTFAVRIGRRYPSGVMVDTILRFPGTAFQDTFVLTHPVDRVNGLGLNQFEVELDALYEIQESDETNNKATVPLYIKAANLIPVYPYEFSIVPSGTVTLWASTTDPFSTQKRYHFQLDDDPGFQSPLAVHAVNGPGGIFQWTPSLTLTDSTVYFWRVAVDSADHPEGIFDWRMSSFHYIDGKTGWSQSHFHQFTKDEYQYIRQDTLNQQFAFVQDNIGITAQTGVYPNFPANQHYYAINGVLEYLSSYMISQNLPGGFVFAVFDTLEGKPLTTDNQSGTWDGPWGNLQEPTTTLTAFEFPTHSVQWQTKLTNFFDSIPNGYYVLAYSIKDHQAPTFPEALYQAFEGIGSSMIRTLPANSPYIIFGRKGAAIGDPLQVTEKMKSISTDSVRLEKTITTNWNSGQITSTDIGPASSWSAIYWKQGMLPTDPFFSDIVTYSVYGVDVNGAAFLFPNLSNLLANTDSVTNLGQIIDATLYPYLRLRVQMKDPLLHTPSQIKSWKVMYTPVGETALDPVSRYTFYSDTIQKGDSLRFSIATRNISPYPMDSLLVKWWILDGERILHHTDFKRYGPHPAGDTLYIDSIGFNTSVMSPGLSTLWIEVNPINPQTGRYDQPEQTHVNNIGEKVFLLKADDENPLLNVTFDGVRILDGDLVSARPAIEIQLNDENRFFVMNQPQDTALFRIYLKYPGGLEYVPVHFMQGAAEQMIFYPASGTGNKCRILFPADFLGTNGTFILRVEAMDKSQNQSGAIHYQISFRVESKATITEVLNWPNPFTTKTHFVFTLTGYEVPVDFRIQIMTVNGRMIRELTLAELGPLHIGRNITTGCWDGKDEFGDQVANGIYLYRVLTRLQGEEVEKATSGADRFFTEGWGKMYLMR